MKHIFNDGGRAAAGYKGKTGDCVVRAVAIATGLPYKEVYDALASANQRTRIRRASGKRTARSGVWVTGKPFMDYMASIGWRWTPTMHIGSGCKVHLRDGELPTGRLVVSLSRHYTAVIDGVIHDRFNPERDGTRCVYGYWMKAVS